LFNMIPRSRLAEANTSRSEGTDTQKFTPISYQRNVPIGTKRLNIPMSLSHRDISLVEVRMCRFGFCSLGTVSRN
jgi:hypothetical protein